MESFTNDLTENIWNSGKYSCVVDSPCTLHNTSSINILLFPQVNKRPLFIPAANIRSLLSSRKQTLPPSASTRDNINFTFALAWPPFVNIEALVLKHISGGLVRWRHGNFYIKMTTPEFLPLQLQLECHRTCSDKNFLPSEKMFGMEVVLQIFATFICCSAARCCCSHSYIFIWSTRSDTLYAGCGCYTALMAALGDANGDRREEIYLGRKWMITGILLSLWAGDTLDVTNTELI